MSGRYSNFSVGDSVNLQSGQGNAHQSQQNNGHNHSPGSNRGRGRGLPSGGYNGGGRAGNQNSTRGNRGRFGSGFRGGRGGHRGGNGGGHNSGPGQVNSHSFQPHYLPNLPSEIKPGVTPAIPEGQRDEFVKIVKEKLVLPREDLVVHGVWKNYLHPKSDAVEKGLGLGYTRQEMKFSQICENEQCGMSYPDIKASGKKCTHHPRIVTDAQGMDYCGNCQNDLDMPGCQETAGGHKLRASAKFAGMNFLPASSPDARRIVATDSEHLLKRANGRKDSHDTVVGWITVSDVLTGEILIHCYVFPERSKIKGFHKETSGLSWDLIETTLRSRNCYSSLEQLTTAMGQFCSSETIIVGFALSNDLKAGFLCHPPSAIVDTQLLVLPWRGCKKQGYAKLRDTVAAKLGITIQQDGETHSCVDDCLATRELLVWLVNELRQSCALPALAGGPSDDPYADQDDDEWYGCGAAAGTVIFVDERLLSR